MPCQGWTATNSFPTQTNSFVACVSNRMAALLEQPGSFSEHAGGVLMITPDSDPNL
jgi:hypothetical protein